MILNSKKHNVTVNEAQLRRKTAQNSAAVKIFCSFTRHFLTLAMTQLSISMNKNSQHSVNDMKETRNTCITGQAFLRSEVSSTLPYSSCFSRYWWGPYIPKY